MVSDLVGDGIAPVGEGDQRPTQVQPVGRLYYFRASDGRRPDNDIDDHCVDLGAVIGIQAGENTTPRGHARLILPEAGRRRPDQAESEVILEID